jgi:hypothetical protein
MEPVGEHPIPAGPLAPRWLAYDLGTFRAGVRKDVRLVLENAGTATWRSRGLEGVKLTYHWLDPLGNAIVWDGIRTTFPEPVPPGRRLDLRVRVLAPRPPGSYRLAFDLVDENHFWFAEIGCPTLDVAVEVAPRIAARRLAAVVHGASDAETEAALAAQEEPLVADEPTAVAHLVAGAVPAPDWSRRLLDAHAEGYSAVGGAIDAADRRTRRRLAAWAPGGGRNPSFDHPLLLPSLLDGVAPTEHQGLPAHEGYDSLFDGRIVVTLRRLSGRPHG